MPGGAKDGGAQAGGANEFLGQPYGDQAAAAQAAAAQAAADEDEDEDDEDDEGGGKRVFDQGGANIDKAANIGVAAGGDTASGRGARAGGSVHPGTVSWISNSTITDGSANIAGVNGTTTSPGLQGQIEEIFGKLPLWAWGAIGSAAALLVCGGGAAASISSRRKKRKKQQKLEDVQPVFQTETWRKLN